MYARSAVSAIHYQKIEQVSAIHYLKIEQLNIEEYIASGTLELYVMGALPEEEAQQVASLSEQYEEVKQEIEAIEAALMAFSAGMHHRKLSPQARVFKEVPPSNGHPPQETAKVVPLRPHWRVWAWAIAASIMLIFSLGLNYYYFQKWKDADQELLALQQEKEQILAQDEVLQTRLEEALTLLSEPDFQRVQLKGTKLAPGAGAVVWWNPRTQNLYVQGSRLPAPKAGFQYQLWAMEKGKAMPTDAGVFDLTQPLKPQKNIKGEPLRFEGEIEAFAITLEPAGGKPTPTLEQLYALGKLTDA
ncbi:MAG: anti-sigma factor [Bacteroidetes bacterium]|nr:MAG: anti-sigma factor [Bacteroidota bacterium]